MDPVTLATITSGVTVLASEVVKGAAGEAGKELWRKIKSLFKWKDEPPLADLAKNIAEELQKDPRVASQIVELLRTDAKLENAGVLVSNINAEKVLVAGTIHVEGDFHM
jgi:hypothetical protein